ncbi:class I SAM-dependent methyltransferase [Kutzneria sp. CA-103260]|uniref:class I SAM-dependent methyltransferase n=1 Tax=Kutzneria sp. CA-103260 TaxID=2802641 RepID=UPI001BA82114|nr:class I SAM-dependent methyltransferase [Kutzneria sp. CA-103260]QUQ63390.1 class I SAM-dependent methyltransferase [Kutzneria sp. CA-103260]
MTTTRDGCTVELYALLPPAGEPEVIHQAIPAGATVLDLGTGAGRIALPLAALGHPVTGVDNSAEMLAHVRNAETVLADIETLRLGRRFDAVLLASNLLNTPETALRRAFLATAAYHADGPVIVQWTPPAWFDTMDAGTRQIGPVTVTTKDIVRDGDLLSATAQYDTADQHWEHAFTALRLSTSDVEEELAAVGLRLERWLTEDQSWFTATVREPNQRSSVSANPSALGSSDAQAT